MRKIFNVLLIVLASSLIFLGCEKNNPFSSNPVSGKKAISLPVNSSCKADTVLLYAAQYYPWGIVITSNDGANLYVKYVSYLAHFDSLYLWVGTDLANLPLKPNGSANPNQFPKKVDAMGALVYTIQIPLAEIFPTSVANYCDREVFIVPHAKMSKPGMIQYLYGGDVPVNVTDINRWYYYYDYAICCTQPEVVSYIDETAYGKFSKVDGGYVFSSSAKSNPESYPSLLLTMNQWGWAGKLGVGSYVAPLYAGAGLNKIANGTYVGNVSVDVSLTSIKVSYNLLAGFLLSEVHFYATDAKPVKLAPGLYGNTFGFAPKPNTFSYTVNVSDLDNDGKFWVITHAVVSIPQY